MSSQAEPRKNPWGLTNRQAEVMRAVARIGYVKGAADSLGISARTVDATTATVREKMGMGRRGFRYIIEFALWDAGLNGPGEPGA